jgi:glycosyltransferase involved in cell wall biosynthesis
MLCGDGEDRNRIEEMIRQHSMEEYLELSGHLPYADVLKLMQRSKILLHPSSYEGFGMVCLEALYAGAHVISFTQPMHHDIKNWHVVKTTEEMQAKASELLASSDTALRTGFSVLDG